MQERWRNCIEKVRGWLPLAALFVACSTVAAPNYVPSESMTPTLRPGDVLLLNKHAFGWRVPFTTVKVTEGSAPARGDVVTFHPWGAWAPNSTYVKRVVGVPGDRIHLAQGRLQVNGQTVSEAPGLNVGEINLVVPPDAVFVAGDNAFSSLDSRYQGVLPLKNLTGRVERVLRLDGGAIEVKRL